MRIERSVSQLALPIDVRSIFLYGSAARRDADDLSDVELGVIPHDGADLGRSRIAHVFASVPARAYVFDLHGLATGALNVPFVGPILQREIAVTARSVWGDHLVEALKPLPITAGDVTGELRFQLGRTLTGLGCLRTGTRSVAADAWSKGCWYGLRCLAMTAYGTFPVDREAVAAAVGKHSLAAGLANRAAAVRRDAAAVTERDFFSLFDFLNDVARFAAAGSAARILVA
jgi:hypothetical protein